MLQSVFKRLVDKLQSCYKLESNKQEARVFSSGLEYDLKFFGWCHNPAKNNDKIWGWIEIEGKLYNFWGRRDRIPATARA
jgi:hypothetical protein